MLVLNVYLCDGLVEVLFSLAKGFVQLLFLLLELVYLLLKFAQSVNLLSGPLQLLR